MNQRSNVAAWFSLTAIVVVGLIASGCSRDKLSPEQQVLRTIAQGLAAAESRSVDTLEEMLTSDFQDNHGNDRRRTLALLRIYFLQHQSIHLFAQTKSVRFPDPKTADAVVVVAMAGQPIDTAETAQRLRANMFRFEIRFVSDGGSTWKASRANWQYAEFGDLF